MLDQLTTIEVSQEHPTLATISGVLFDKTTKRLLCYPAGLGQTSYETPRGIRSIGAEAFCCCEALTSVTLPDTVTEVADSAFVKCVVTSVTLPAAAFSLADAGLGTVTHVVIPDSMSLTDYSGNPFRMLDQLTTIEVSQEHPTLALIDGVLFDKPTKRLVCYPVTMERASYEVPRGIRIIGEYAFWNCRSLTDVALPDTVTEIGAYAFDCCGLTSVTIPDAVTAIGEYAFSGSGLTSVTIPDQVTEISPFAFYWCHALTSVTLQDSVTAIGEYAFARCGGLTSIMLPDSVTEIGGYAFSECRGLTSVTIPEGVTEIENGLFYDCDGLTRVELPEGLTRIEREAFAECRGLTDMNIPAGVTVIAPNAGLENAENLTLTIERDSAAVEYCKEHGIKYVYSDYLDWLFE